MRNCANCGRFDGKVCYLHDPPKKVSKNYMCGWWLGLCTICARNKPCEYKKPFHMGTEITCALFLDKEVKEE